MVERLCQPRAWIIAPGFRHRVRAAVVAPVPDYPGEEHGVLLEVRSLTALGASRLVLRLPADDCTPVGASISTLQWCTVRSSAQGRHPQSGGACTGSAPGLIAHPARPVLNQMQRVPLWF